MTRGVDNLRTARTSRRRWPHGTLCTERVARTLRAPSPPLPPTAAALPLRPPGPSAEADSGLTLHTATCHVSPAADAAVGAAAVATGGASVDRTACEAILRPSLTLPPAATLQCASTTDGGMTPDEGALDTSTRCLHCISCCCNPFPLIAHWRPQYLQAAVKRGFLAAGSPSSTRLSELSNAPPTFRAGNPGAATGSAPPATVVASCTARSRFL